MGFNSEFSECYLFKIIGQVLTSHKAAKDTKKIMPPFVFSVSLCEKLFMPDTKKCKGHKENHASLCVLCDFV